MSLAESAEPIRRCRSLPHAVLRDAAQRVKKLFFGGRAVVRARPEAEEVRLALCGGSGTFFSVTRSD